MSVEGPKKPTSRDFYFLAFRIIGDFGAAIALPVVLFVFIGQKLDAEYSTAPLFTILGFILAALLSARIIYKKAKKYGTEFKDLSEAEDLNNKHENK